MKTLLGILGLFVLLILVRIVVAHGPGLWLPTHIAGGWMSVDCGRAWNESQAETAMSCVVNAQRQDHSFIAIFTVKGVEGPLNLAFVGSSNGNMVEIAQWEDGKELHWANCPSAQITLSPTGSSDETPWASCGATDDRTWHRIPW